MIVLLRLIGLMMIVMLLLTGASVRQTHAQDIDFVPVVVAQQELPRGLLLTEDNVLGEDAVVRIAFYPAGGLPATAIQTLEELVGTVLRTDVPTENPLVRHYLFPHPRLLPGAEVPFPISPPGMRVVQSYDTFREMSFENTGQFLFPARLAAGDRVDIVTSTVLGNPLQDEATILLEGVVVARRDEASIAFSASEENLQILSEYVELGAPMTLMIHAMAGDAEIDSLNPINWEYLTTREDNPLTIPPGADLSSVGR